MTDSNTWRYRAKRRQRGEMELRDFWLTYEQRCALAAMRLISRDEVDDPDAVAEALDRVLAGLAKKFRPDV